MENDVVKKTRKKNFLIKLSVSSWCSEDDEKNRDFKKTKKKKIFMKFPLIWTFIISHQV